jgi:hypothetical protein
MPEWLTTGAPIHTATSNRSTKEDIQRALRVASFAAQNQPRVFDLSEHLSPSLEQGLVDFAEIVRAANYDVMGGADIIPSAGDVGFMIECLLKGGDGLGDQVLFAECVGQVIMCFCRPDEAGERIQKVVGGHGGGGVRSIAATCFDRRSRCPGQGCRVRQEQFACSAMSYI